MARGDKMESIWSEKWPRIPADKRELPKQAEVVIIGGGMAGLLCAYFLKEAGIGAIVLEADRICSGQTKNTTAKITSQHGLIYGKLMENAGEDAAIRYGRINERAIDVFEDVIRKEKIECGFVRAPAYLYTKLEAGAQLLKKEYDVAKKAGIKASLVEETSLPFSVRLALRYEDQAQFHPLEFLAGIALKLEIYEKTRVLRLKGNTVITNRGPVEAKGIVIATHFPFMNFPGFYFARMHQERSYVLAVEAEHDLDGMYYGIDADGLSLRSAGGMVLLGGKSERTGLVQPENPYDALRREARKIWPNFREKAYWAAQDCMTLDSLPYIGRFSPSRPDWYVATGFEKWGMTNSMIAAMAIHDLMTKNSADPWLCVSPQRKMTVKSFEALVRESLFAASHFLTLKRPRCPHLGCRLVWNRYEKTWDCPCHGSRFAKDGKLIDNPAQENL